NNADILLVIDALEVAYTNPLIDSFCIVSGDSDYTPLVGRLKSMGKFVLGISRSEAASNIFINACNEFQFLENVGGRTRKPNEKKKTSSDKEPLDEQELNKLLSGILEEQTDKDELYASELKGILLRLRPDFNEKAYGCATFLKVLDKLVKQYGTLRIRNDNFNVMVAIGQGVKETPAHLNKENWRDTVREQLQRYKEDGFERINPSILKADIQANYPDFSEKALGFKRFSDMLKALEKDGLLTVELDEQKTMLIKVP
ncbi:MAG: NYN domain-containing protein, partial [Clostridia bacterium]